MYVLRCKPGTDLELASAIRSQGVECLCVTVSRLTLDPRTKERVLKLVPAYPGYLFTSSPTPFRTYAGFVGYMRHDEKYLEVPREAVDSCVTHMADRVIHPYYSNIAQCFPGTLVDSYVMNKFRKKGYRVNGQG